MSRSGGGGQLVSLSRSAILPIGYKGVTKMQLSAAIKLGAGVGGAKRYLLVGGAVMVLDW